MLTWYQSVANCSAASFQLPVEHPLVDASDDHGSFGVVVEHRVHVPGHVAERLAQRDGLGVPGAEDQSVVALDVRDLDQAPVRRRKESGIAHLVGDADEPAFEVVGPAVVGAGEVPGLTEVRAAHPGAAMPAGVEIRLDLAGSCPW